MSDKAQRLGIQETDGTLDRIDLIMHAVEDPETSLAKRQGLYANIGLYIAGRWPRIRESLEFAAYLIDEDESAEINTIKLLAWLALRSSDNESVLTDQLEMTSEKVDDLDNSLHDEIPLNLRNKTTRYLFGWIEDEEGNTIHV